MIYERIEDMVGNTPLIRLGRLFPYHNVFCKLETHNPTGSFKDRIVWEMFKNAVADETLKPGMTIVEASSGNTAISIAMMAQVKGFKLIIFIPTTASLERKKILRFMGAEVIEVPDMNIAIQSAKAMVENGEATSLKQFTNRHNAEAHYLHTGKEIWEALNGRVDLLVAGSGTGGLIMGVKRYIKERNPYFQVAQIEPKSGDSALRASHILRASPIIRHRLEGISVGVPNQLDRRSVNYLIEISDDEAFMGCKLLAQKEGILAGVTSGAACLAIQKNLHHWGQKNIVMIACDPAERYISTALFSEKETIT